MDTSLAISTAVMVLSIVSMVTIYVGATVIQWTLFPITVGLMLWFLSREALTFDAEAGTVTFHFRGR